MSGPETRRYPRVAIQTDMAEMRGELQALITWPNLEVSDVRDLSFRGFAARRPGLFPFAAQEVVDLHLTVGLFPSFKIRGRIVWFNLDAVGVEMIHVPAEGLIRLRDFLDAKLLGLALRPVQASLFAKGSTFDFWLQGPGDCHVFVWMKSPVQISHVVVELAGESLRFDREKKLQRQSSNSVDLERKALLVLSQMDKPDLPMEEFVRSIVTGV